MIEGTTSTGYKFSIPEAIKSDWRFVRKLSELAGLEESEAQEIDFIRIMGDIEKILFPDKGKGLENHIASIKEGTVPTDFLLKELLEIIKTNPETKN